MRELRKIKLLNAERNLAETGMYRFKTLFGGDLKCRTFEGQGSEAYAKSIALNTMTRLGMPQSEKW